MDPTDSQQLAALAALFQKTLDASQRQGAEEQLAQLQAQPRFSFLVLALVQSSEFSTAIRLAAAIQFKNLCKTRWVVDAETEDPVVGEVPAEEKAALRQQLVPVLVSLAQAPSPSQAILAQLNESIALVATADFPEAWPALIDELVAQLSTDNHHVLLSILATSHAAFKHWRHEFRSDALYTEINMVLDKMAMPLLELLQRVHAMLLDAATPSGAMAPLATCLMLLLQLFYDLSAQDLPPQFEDALPALSPIWTSLLSFSRRELVGDEDDVAPSALDKIRSSVCEIFELYAKRYLDVLPQLPEYVQAVWDMLGTYSAAEKYDVIVSKAIHFLSAVVRMGTEQRLFESPEALERVCAAIIVPNMTLREVEEEMFEDNPMEYIRRDLEQSIEMDTRRRAACELVRALLERVPEQMTSIASRQIQADLAAYAAAPNDAWKRKDAAVCLLTAVATQGATAQHGVSATNSMVDVVQFFSEHIGQDLDTSSSVPPILQVDAIKYLYTFRNQLTKAQLLSVLPLLVQHLGSSNYVACAYAAITIERVLALQSQGTRMWTPEDVAPMVQSMLHALVAAVEQHDTPEKVAENDAVMKCMMRVVLTARGAVAPYASEALEHLASIVRLTARNVSNPRFTQFLFESIAALVQTGLSGSREQLAAAEAHLFPVLTEVLQNDVTEYMPYAFQLLAQLLEAHAALGGDAALPDAYASLLPPLLMPALWEAKGQVPALVRLLRAYVAQAPSTMAQHTEACLGIYQKLISSRLLDTYGFDVLRALLSSLPASTMAPYMQPVLTLMLVRLQSSRTDKFSQHFIAFLGFLAGLQQPGYPDQLLSALDAVQPGLAAQLLENVVAPELARLPRPLRFDTVVGIVRLLTESRAMLQMPAWPPLMTATVHLLAETSPPATDDAALDDAEIDEQGYQATFTRLVASRPAKERDASAWAGPDARAYLAQQLRRVQAEQPGALAPLLERLPQDVATTLRELMA